VNSGESKKKYKKDEAPSALRKKTRNWNAAGMTGKIKIENGKSL
jgi:hypothetical protein